MTFRRIAFVTGPPAGLLCAATFSIFTEFSWPDFALTAIATGTMFGFALAWLSTCYAARFYRSLVPVVALLPAMAGASVAAIGALLWLATFLPHGSWSILPSPPEAAVNLTGPECASVGGYSVVAVSKAGIHYALVREHDSDRRWTTLDSLPKTEGSIRCGPGSHLVPPPAPGDVRATHVVAIDGVDAAVPINMFCSETGQSGDGRLVHVPLWTCSGDGCSFVPR